MFEVMLLGLWFHFHGLITKSDGFRKECCFFVIDDDGMYNQQRC